MDYYSLVSDQVTDLETGSYASVGKGGLKYTLTFRYVCGPISIPASYTDPKLGQEIPPSIN